MKGEYSLSGMIDIKFFSDEKEFLYSFGVNKGYTIIYDKVLKCLFLSSNAKQLYINLCNYACKGNNSVKQALLRIELGWSKETFNTYLNELKTYGLIVCESQGRGKPLLYKLQELHKVKILIHSEIVFSLMNEFKLKSSSNLEKFYNALQEYKESELFKEITEKELNPLDYKEEIKKWFYAKMFREEHKEESQSEEPIAPPKETVSIPVWNLGDGVGYESEQTAPKKRKFDYKNTPVNEWNTNHFCNYFCDLYYKKFKIPYAITKCDRGAMKSLLERRQDKQLIKKHLENYMDIDFFETKTIKGFTSSYVQSVLDSYAATGKLPQYKDKGSTKIKIKEEWAKGIDDFFEGSE